MSVTLFDDGRVRLVQGDALDELAFLEDSGALDGLAAVVTDPPYASGTRLEANKSASGAMVRAGRFADRPIDLDQMTTTGFVWLMRSVASFAYRLLPDGGSFLSFIDWRQWPNLVGALETANLRVQGMVVWDKGSFGLGNGFRSQHELVCHAAKGVPVVHDRGAGNVFRFGRASTGHHPSPKPVELMEALLRVVVPPGGLVLDPFAGGGTTLLAARNLGMRAVGVEAAPNYAAHAAERLGGPFVAEPGSLFGEAAS